MNRVPRGRVGRVAASREARRAWEGGGGERVSLREWRQGEMKTHARKKFPIDPPLKLKFRCARLRISDSKWTKKPVFGGGGGDQNMMDNAQKSISVASKLSQIAPSALISRSSLSPLRSLARSPRTHSFLSCSIPLQSLCLPSKISIHSCFTSLALPFDGRRYERSACSASLDGGGLGVGVGVGVDGCWEEGEEESGIRRTRRERRSPMEGPPGKRGQGQPKGEKLLTQKSSEINCGKTYPAPE